jgi:hypothetical protein
MAHLRIALLIVIILGVAAHLLALTCTGPSPDIVGAKAAWKLGAIIKVTASNFPPALQPCVQKAFDNWNAANPSTNANGNASDVKYSSKRSAEPRPMGRRTACVHRTHTISKPQCLAINASFRVLDGTDGQPPLLCRRGLLPMPSFPGRACSEPQILRVQTVPYVAAHSSKVREHLPFASITTKAIHQIRESSPFNR